MSRILVVERDGAVAERLADGLSIAGHDVRIEPDASSGAAAAMGWMPALVILEPMCKVRSGDYLIRVIKRCSPDIVVLAMDKEGGEAAAVLALRLGADDHIAGPVRVLEFLARVEALLRRAAWSARTREMERRVAG